MNTLSTEILELMKKQRKLKIKEQENKKSKNRTKYNLQIDLKNLRELNRKKEQQVTREKKWN